MIPVSLIILGIIFLFGLLFYEKQGDKRAALIAKTILSLLFVITALMQPPSEPTYALFLIIGLTFCLAGDICLALPGEGMFRMGLISFLLGHVFYVASFLSLVEFSQWISPGALLMLGISGFVFFRLRPHLKTMLVPVLLYILVITIMAIGAWAAFWRTDFGFSGKAFILIGALCFYSSDLFVARDKFVREEYSNRLIGLPLYYSGQFLFAFSIGLLQ